MVMALKPIDIKQSYIPGDPNAIAANLEFTRAEDDPRAPVAITPFEGYNFLPTDYGYRSYFGINALLNIPIVPSRCEDVFIFRSDSLNVLMVALCEDGIWTKDPSTASGSWVHQVVFTLANPLPAVVTIEGSSPSTTEESTVTFTSLEPGQAVTVGGHTYTATLASTAAQVATALSGGGSPNGVLSGALVNWTLVLDGPGVITYTSTTPNANVSNLPISVSTPFATSYDPLLYRRWTSVRIDNDTYFYNTGRETIEKLSSALVWSSLSPNFITMSGQVGIFQAGGRMGMWDTLNSVSNSSVFAFDDFTPSLETLANVTKFRAVTGKIVTIIKHGDGFVIYSTESITSVRLNSGSSGLLWDAVAVSKTKGITHPGEVAVGITSLEHYVYTTEGLIVLKNFNAFTRQHEIETALTPVVDFIREDNDQVQIKVLQARYVFFNLINVNYINGRVHSFEETSAMAGAVEVLYRDGTNVRYRDTTNLLFRGSVTLPSTVFNISGGALTPMYPTYKGSLVFDTKLEKWGKFKGDFKVVMELVPSNTFDAETVGFTTFGMNVGILQPEGTIRIFDSTPTDSLCRWGKYGLSRLGFTTLLTAEISFRSNSTGTVITQSSLNNRDFSYLLTKTTAFTDTRVVEHKQAVEARWHTLALTGQWDLQQLSIAGKVSGRR